MRSVLSVASSILFILAGASPFLAQTRANTLRGVVTVPSNVDPSFMVRIRLEQSGMPVQEVMPFGDSFEFFNVREGHYTVVFDAPGYESVQQEVSVPGSWPYIELRPIRNVVRPTEVVPIWNLRVPESARRQFRTAERKLRENDCEQALAYLKKAITRYSEYGDAHRDLGECYVRMNQLETAEQEFKLALEQPHMPEVHLLLASVYARENNLGPQERQLDLYAEEKLNRQPGRQ